MAKQNIYPLIYKPGIKRDGTPFQGDFCTSGQWVRFHNGNIKKMGGMKGVSQTGGDVEDSFLTTNITLLPSNTDDDYITVYMGHNDGVTKCLLTQDYNLIQDSATPVYARNGNIQAIWQSETIIQPNPDDPALGSQRIVFLGAINMLNINSSTPSILLFGNLTGGDYNLRPPFGIGRLPNLNGATGVLYANPYLFVYGSNGLLQWSDPANPEVFPLNNSIFVSKNDKIIHVESIRGGVNTPTLLCWTLNSVIRCINTGTGIDLDFQKDVISESSSILSSRCVVEYDGMFYWPGTNRFYYYNGINRKLDNFFNMDFFFDRIDMKHRQKVFGVKNTRYDEIWWFYPEKGQNPDLVVNNRALIYNVSLNCWYDTAISRDAGAYSEEFGFMTTYGKSLTDPDNVQTTLYRHEFETFENEQNSIKEQVPAQNIGDVAANPITSSVTTPTISWAAFNPMKQLSGIDKWMYVVTIEPDFVLTDINTDLTMTVNTRQYAQSPPISYGPYPIPGLNPNAHDAIQDKLDIAVQGRHITYTFQATTNFEMGQIMMTIAIGDGQ